MCVRAMFVATTSLQLSPECTILYPVCVAAAILVCVFLGAGLVCCFLAGLLVSGVPLVVCPVDPVWRVPPSGESIHL